MKNTPVVVLKALLDGKNVKLDDSTYALRRYGDTYQMCVEGIRYATCDVNQVEPQSVWLPVEMSLDRFVMCCFGQFDIPIEFAETR